MAGVVVFEAEAIIFPDQLAFQLSRNGSAVHRFSGPRFLLSTPHAGLAIGAATFCTTHPRHLHKTRSPQMRWFALPCLRRPEQQLREVGAEYIRKNSAPGFPVDGFNFLCPIICAVRVHHSRYTPPISHPI